MDRDIPSFNRPIMQRIYAKNLQLHQKKLQSIKVLIYNLLSLLIIFLERAKADFYQKGNSYYKLSSSNILSNLNHLNLNTTNYNNNATNNNNNSTSNYRRSKYLLLYLSFHINRHSDTEKELVDRELGVSGSDSD